MRINERLRTLRTAVMAPPTPPPAGQPVTSDADAFALRTYRYVRVLIVVLTVGLLSSVFVEQATSNCVLGSISAYYYTPARGLFTGGLIGIGVCLIAIRGENELQDGLLTVAGLFGPMVALVPMHLQVLLKTGKPTREAFCIINAHRVNDIRPGDIKEAAFNLNTAGRIDSIRNDTWALLIMLALGLLTAGWIIWWGRRHPRARAATPKPKWWPLIVSALAVAALWALYVFGHDFYLEHVHFTTAILMFVAVSAFAIVDGIRTIQLQHAVKRGVAYIVMGAALILGCLVIMLIGNAVGYDYTTLTAELWGIGFFLAFWIVQTIDLWNHTSRRTAILSAAP